jgi:ADP-ribose pyrophosphatase
MSHPIWTLLGSREIAQYPILRLREDRYRIAPSQAEGAFLVCESNDWVLVIAITTDRQVIFIRQYRHGVQHDVLEIPGGVMDHGETPEQTATRELLEETGFRAQSVRWLGRLLPNPALNSAGCHICVAEDCVPVSDQAPDPFESIEILLRPLPDVPDMIRRGELCHAQVIAGFALWHMDRPIADGVLTRARSASEGSQEESP